MDAQPRIPTSTRDATWRALLPLCLTAFAVIVHASALAPLATAMARDLGTSVPRIAQVSTALLAAMGLAGFLVGPLADHFGHRRVLLLGLATLATSAVAMALAPSYPALLAGGLLAGVGATILGVTFAVAARHPSDTGRALGRVQAAQTAGSILGAPLLTAVAAATGWRGAYTVVLATYLLAFALVARTLARDQRPNGILTMRAILAAYRPLARDRRMRALYIASALRALGWLGPFLYFGAFLADRHGLSLRQIGLVYMVASGGMFVGNLATGQWGGGHTRRTFAIATGILSLTWVVIYATPLPILPTVAAVTLAACTAGISWTSLTTLLATETPAGPGTTMTLNGSVFALGSALGSAIGGLVVATGGYTYLGLALPGFTLAAALLVWRPRVAGRRAESAARWVAGGGQ